MNIEINNSIAYFKYDSETYKMDLIDFIIFCKENYDFYFILTLKETINLIKDLMEKGQVMNALKLSSNLYNNTNLNEWFFIVDKYTFSVKAFSNIYQFNKIFNINDIINYIIRGEWVYKYSEKVKEIE